MDDIRGVKTSSVFSCGEVEEGFPFVIRGLISSWPSVEASSSVLSFKKYLDRFDSGKIYHAIVAPPEVNGKIGYSDETMKNFNFRRMKGYLSDIFNIFDSFQNIERPPCFYVGSTPVEEYLPSFMQENSIKGMTASVIPNIWMGNQSVVATHSDRANNLACVVAGRRRFVLFPPDQVQNLYIGRSDHTPAGRPISLVDVDSPDFERFPLYKNALPFAEVAELNPGDAIYIPEGWWHNVTSLDAMNVLVNYWWSGHLSQS